jgi:hypothetical protein
MRCAAASQVGCGWGVLHCYKIRCYKCREYCIMMVDFRPVDCTTKRPIQFDPGYISDKIYDVSCSAATLHACCCCCDIVHRTAYTHSLTQASSATRSTT